MQLIILQIIFQTMTYITSETTSLYLKIKLGFSLILAIWFLKITITKKNRKLLWKVTMEHIDGNSLSQLRMSECQIFINMHF